MKRIFIIALALAPFVGVALAIPTPVPGEISLTFTIPDGQIIAIRDDFCAAHGYRETIDGAPNPQSKQEFIKQVITHFIRSSVRAYRAEQAIEAARQASETATDAIPID